MSRTTFAIYSSPANAEAAAVELREAQLPNATIRMISSDGGECSDVLMGKDGLNDTFERAAQRGCSIVAVASDERDLDRVMEAINHHEPLEVEQHTSSTTADVDFNQKLPLGHMQQKIDEETAREDWPTKKGRRVWD
jgi:hypothetical protein